MPTGAAGYTVVAYALCDGANVRSATKLFAPVVVAADQRFVLAAGAHAAVAPTA